MRWQSFVYVGAAVALLNPACRSLVRTREEITDKQDPNQSAKYLQAVREFADNVLKYGRDTYGPKHTPLFVDGLNIHTHEPVKWIAPNGDRWILSNLASQQDLFRTLDALTIITGDPKYRQAAMDAIKYAFQNLRSPNGLLYWGGHSAYDAGADKPCGRGVHEFKGCYPYYDMMWEANAQATKQFIEAFWSGHILDWSNLDMDRHCYNMTRPLNKPWEYEYKGGTVFFGGKGLSFLCTGGDLFYAAAWLTKLSGEKEPLVWGKRLAQRYCETRDPKTGIGAHGYTGKQKKIPTIDGLKDIDLNTMDYSSFFPFCPTYGNSEIRRCCYGYCAVSPGIPYNIDEGAWVSALLVGEMMGSDARSLIQWSIEELTARGRVAFRKSDSSWIPMLLNGIHLEGQVIKKGGPFGPEGTRVESVPTIPMDFWTYSLAYRLTGNEFMWQMARNIAFGNGFGDIGTTSTDSGELKHSIDCADPYALMGFLELYKRTGRKVFLGSARQVGDNILNSRFYKGFFAPSSKHIYTRFDSPEALALLHLYTASVSHHVKVPTMWPCLSFFEEAYRDKDAIDDIGLIYTLRDSLEPPISLQEASNVGDIGLVRSLIEKGVDINAREESFFKTALHWAAIKGRKDIAELLIAKGADVNARDSYVSAPLHYAAQNGHRDIAELLIAKGADVNAKNGAGDPPLQAVACFDHKDVIQLLLKEGATIANLHIASYVGDITKAEALIKDSVNINALDGHGYAPLHYAAKNSQKQAVELLLAKGADVNAKTDKGETPMAVAQSNGQGQIVDLLRKHGAKEQ